MTQIDFSFCESVVAGVFEAVGVGAHVDGDVAKNDDFLVEVLGVAFQIEGVACPFGVCGVGGELDGDTLVWVDFIGRIGDDNVGFNGILCAEDGLSQRGTFDVAYDVAMHDDFGDADGMQFWVC